MAGNPATGDAQTEWMEDLEEETAGEQGGEEVTDTTVTEMVGEGARSPAAERFRSEPLSGDRSPESLSSTGALPAKVATVATSSEAAEKTVVVTSLCC